MKIPVRIQMTPGENGATALFMMLGYFGKHVPMAELRENCVTSRNGSSPQQLKNAAEQYGLTCEISRKTIGELEKEKLPVMVRWKKRYYLIVTKMNKDKVWVTDPAKGEYISPMESFSKNFANP